MDVANRSIYQPLRSVLEDLAGSEEGPDNSLVKRFTAMYDIQNNTQQSPALLLLTGGTGQAASPP